MEVAAAMLSSLNSEKTNRGAVWVLSARLPETNMVAPNSPKERMKVKTHPEMSPPLMAGKTMLVKIWTWLAPRIFAASSSVLSVCSKMGPTALTTKGKVKNTWAMRMPGKANTMVIPAPSYSPPNKPIGPYSSRIESPITDGGMVKGTSTNAFSKPLNGKLCFTNMKANTVPITPLITVVASASARENLREKRASEDEMFCQNPVWNRYAYGSMMTVARKTTPTTTSKYFARVAQGARCSETAPSVAPITGCTSIGSPSESAFRPV